MGRSTLYQRIRDLFLCSFNLSFRPEGFPRGQVPAGVRDEAYDVPDVAWVDVCYANNGSFFIGDRVA